MTDLGSDTGTTCRCSLKDSLRLAGIAQEDHQRGPLTSQYIGARAVLHSLANAWNPCLVITESLLRVPLGTTWEIPPPKKKQAKLWCILPLSHL